MTIYLEPNAVTPKFRLSFNMSAIRSSTLLANLSYAHTGHCIVVIYAPQIHSAS